MILGPLQLIVIGLDEDKYHRDIILELKKLRHEHVIRLIDLLHIIKHSDGRIASKQASDLEAEEQRAFGGLVKGLIELAAQDMAHTTPEQAADLIHTEGQTFGLSESEIQQVAEQLPNGSAAIFIIFEHLWARSVKYAMQQAGGTVLAQGLISPETLTQVANELTAVLEAIDKAEAAAMGQMAEVLTDTKVQTETAVAEAEEVQQAAAAQKEAALQDAAKAEAIKQTAVLSAIQVLKRTKLLTEEAEQEAMAALAEAELIEAEAVAEADRVVMEQQQREDDAFTEAEAVRHAARRQEEEAIAEAAAVVQQAQELEAKAVLRALNAMVAARYIEDTAAKEALQAIINAKVIEAAAASEAARSLAEGY